LDGPKELKVTLVLTELSHVGIAMATDSAVTFAQGGTVWAVPSAANKLHVVPNLNAGVSCWGLGHIGNTPTDQWISTFIGGHSSVPTLTAFAQELADELTNSVGRSADGKPRAGFHVAGYLDDGKGPAPALYHVHDGPSEVLQGVGFTIDPHRFNANQDVSSEQTRGAISRGEGILTRNGDYQPYAQLFERLQQFFVDVRPLGILIPRPGDLRDRIEYLIFQIRTVSELYRLSNLVPSIGGAIPYLGIHPGGLHSAGIRYV
jgi:hypothetical protein